MKNIALFGINLTIGGKISFTKNQKSFLDFFLKNEALCLSSTGEIFPISNQKGSREMGLSDVLPVYVIKITGEVEKTQDLKVLLFLGEDRTEREDLIIFREEKMFLLSMYKERRN